VGEEGREEEGGVRGWGGVSLSSPPARCQTALATPSVLQGVPETCFRLTHLTTHPTNQSPTHPPTHPVLRPSAASRAARRTACGGWRRTLSGSRAKRWRGGRLCLCVRKGRRAGHSPPLRDPWQTTLPLHTASPGKPRPSPDPPTPPPPNPKRPALASPTLLLSDPASPSKPKRPTSASPALTPLPPNPKRPTLASPAGSLTLPRWTPPRRTASMRRPARGWRR
jgi:hypothetical protein